jgi:hypothetical protein
MKDIHTFFNNWLGGGCVNIHYKSTNSKTNTLDKYTSNKAVTFSKFANLFYPLNPKYFDTIRNKLYGSEQRTSFENFPRKTVGHIKLLFENYLLIEREINHNKLTYKCNSGEVAELFGDLGVNDREFLQICDFLEGRPFEKFSLESKRKLFER